MTHQQPETKDTFGQLLLNGPLHWALLLHCPAMESHCPEVSCIVNAVNVISMYTKGSEISVHNTFGPTEFIDQNENAVF